MRRTAVVAALAAVVPLAGVTGAAEPGSRAAAAGPHVSLRGAVLKPPPLRLKQRCVTAAERRRVVRFTAVDGTRLIGVMFGRGEGAVALAHQGNSTLCIWVPYARALARAGYRVLVYDQRRFGSSGWPRSSSRLFRVDLDALGAVRELRRRGATRVVLAGASLGASGVVAAAASARPPVDGVVSVSSPTVFVNVDARLAARRLAVPVLFLAAEDDDPFDDAAREMHAAAPAADRQLAVVPGSLHGVALLGVPAVRTLLDGWIAAHLRTGSQ